MNWRIFLYLQYCDELTVSYNFAIMRLFDGYCYVFYDCDMLTVSHLLVLHTGIWFDLPSSFSVLYTCWLLAPGRPGDYYIASLPCCACERGGYLLDERVPKAHTGWLLANQPVELYGCADNSLTHFLKFLTGAAHWHVAAKYYYTFRCCLILPFFLCLSNQSSMSRFTTPLLDTPLLMLLLCPHVLIRVCSSIQWHIHGDKVHNPQP
jgi:hypothetical protein